MSMKKTLDQWPEIKIHVEGGVVNGYYDVTRRSDADYKAILKAATHNRFTVKGGQSLFNFKTASYRSVFPSTIDKSILWFDSVAVSISLLKVRKKMTVMQTLQITELLITV